MHALDSIIVIAYAVPRTEIVVNFRLTQRLFLQSLRRRTAIVVTRRTMHRRRYLIRSSVLWVR